YRVKDINTVDDPSAGWNITRIDAGAGLVFFRATANTVLGPTQLWRSDGTPEGTQPLTETGFEAGAVLNGTFFFLAAGLLWKTDGTPEGTVRVAHVGGTYEANIVVMGGLLYFEARDANGPALWRSDGTAEGTWKVASGEFERLAAAGNVLL